MNWALIIFYALAVGIGGALGLLAYRLSPTGRATRNRIKELRAQRTKLEDELKKIEERNEWLRKRVDELKARIDEKAQA